MFVRNNRSIMNTFRNDFMVLSKERRNVVMVVKGNVVGHVDITDLGKRIAWNQEVSFSEYEVNRSRDLLKAIRMKWVLVIEDKGLLKRAIVLQSQQIKKEEDMDKEEILSMAKQMAKEMAKEMMKDSEELTKNIIKETAKEMMQGMNTGPNISVQDVIDGVSKNVSEEIKKIPTAQPTMTQSDPKFTDSPKDVFVEFDDKDVQMDDSGVKDIGKVKKEKADIVKSLDKMKTIRRKKKSEEDK